MFFDAQRASAHTANKAKFQLSNFCRRATDYLEARFKSYDSWQRLDTFYSEVLANDQQSVELWSVVCKVLVLSHGKANVE